MVGMDGMYKARTDGGVRHHTHTQSRGRRPCPNDNSDDAETYKWRASPTYF